jgi:Na+-transporting NADH:ubiquinone oxidoreductase subunit C
MSQNSTGYILGFAAGVCLVCSVFVSGAAVMLKDRQVANEIVDKQKKVLDVSGALRPGESDTMEAAAINELYAEKVVPRLIYMKDGTYLEPVDGKEGFFAYSIDREDGGTVEGEIEIASFDFQKARKHPELGYKAEGNLAKVITKSHVGLVYHVMRGDQIDKLIIPIEGYGLWGTLFGFMAIEKDAQTVAGLTFYKHIETPGLGGEVDNPQWKGLWKGRKLFDAEGKPALEVIKGPAGSVTEAPHHIDGLSGATLTGRGVTHLVRYWTDDTGYGPYLTNFREKGE